MITYNRSAFGLNLLFRVDGSAAYRGVIPGLLSAMIVLLVRYFRNGDGTFLGEARDANDLQHPYAIGFLISSISFVVVFRVQQGYSRYWEAAGSIHQMMSKWMDATIHVGCYHMQCSHYDAIKPPSFFDYPELNAYYLTRDRERFYHAPTNAKVMQDLDDGKLSGLEEDAGAHSNRKYVAAAATGGLNTKPNSSVDLPTDKEHVVLGRAIHKSIQIVEEKSARRISEEMKKANVHDSTSLDGAPFGSDPIPLTGHARLDGNWGKLFPDKKATFYQPKDTDPSSPNYLNSLPSFASSQGGRTPSLFLQELAHLCSLMNAVALATLRNDREGSVSPLGVFKPGEPWPEVDPHQIDNLCLTGPWYSRVSQRIRFFFGFDRSPTERTRYNACRPLEVIGGVSDAEIRFLQMARGPYAKTQLCWYWLSEFLIREHLTGTTGKVGPPIVSRCIQFLGDGMIYYNHARKIMFIPFPFPHAQISVIFILIAIPAVGFLMEQYADQVGLGATLAFFSVAILSGIHEVARELENPFRNTPNELPVVTFQAFFNEALITMYSGFHPDHFWDPKRHTHHPSSPPPEPGPRIRKPGSRGRAAPTSSPGGIRRAVSHDGAILRPTEPKADQSSTVTTPPLGSILRPTEPKADQSSTTTTTTQATTTTQVTTAEATTTQAAGATSICVGRNSESVDLAKMHAKMEEYGKEIERLRKLLENAEDKKSN